MNKNEHTKTIPLNPRGALELGMSPCCACDVGWGTYSLKSNGEVESKNCHDKGECGYWAEYCKLPAKLKDEYND